MSTIQTSSTAHLPVDGAFVGFVRNHRDWVAGGHPLTVRHLPTQTIFELIIHPEVRPGARLTFQDYAARLLHIGVQTPPSRHELAMLRAEALLVRLHQLGLVALFDEEDREIAPDDYESPAERTNGSGAGGVLLRA